MTVRQMLESIDSRELSEWIAYANVEPFGEDRADIRHGIACTVVANSALGSKGGARPADFIPRFGGSRRLSAEETRAKFQAYAQGMGAQRRGR
jgi:hypothetical protein